MEKDIYTTKVIFRMIKGEVLAIFPQCVGTMNVYTCMCYAHIGQHSAMDISYARNGRLARPDEYAKLQSELESLGYNLDIRKRITRLDQELRQRDLDYPYTICAEDGYSDGGEAYTDEELEIINNEYRSRNGH
jgi:hypothetical protein